MMKILEYSQIKGSEIMNSRNREFNDIIQLRVSEIINRVVKGGDKALRELTKELDGADIDSLFVTNEELLSEGNLSDIELEQALNVAASNIEKFHKAQIPVDIEVETSMGVKCFQRSLPVRRVGLYIPGGSAPLFSTLLMLAIPARIAGCREIVICTPPDRNGKVNNIILYLANKLGISEIVKVGGAQAIAAMAYGTESIRRVDKIFGPGNSYVACAKLQLSSKVAIDMVAGPSELMILADDSSIPEFIAADLLSQAEHGSDSQLSFLTTDKYLAEEVNRLLMLQLPELPRRSIAEISINKGFSIVCSSVDEMVDFANLYGAEHLIIS
ncbi:MAG TPA: histidinol dehydrogenase, partial [Bacteroidales bacterium]|nr:histidinol dehydrogenase [Bacteroidales bacterium]